MTSLALGHQTGQCGRGCNCRELTVPFFQNAKLPSVTLELTVDTASVLEACHQTNTQ